MSFVGTKNTGRSDAAPASQLPIVPEPKSIAEAVKSMHDHSARMAHILDRLEQWAELAQEAPEMHTVVINPGNNGAYEVTDTSKRRAVSIGIINPGSANVFVGIGGTSARPSSRAAFVPGAGALILPVRVDYELALGCDPAVLLANSAVVYVFRYQTVQPLLITGNV
jgi:hypothetical protein